MGAPTGTGEGGGVRKMPEAKRLAIQFRRSEGFSLSIIGAEFGISRERVDQILHPEKHRARKLLAYHIKAGNIIRPEVCDGCGRPAKVQGHHEDYSKPKDVRWLCDECHLLADTQRGRFSRRAETLSKLAQ